MPLSRVAAVALLAATAAAADVAITAWAIASSSVVTDPGTRISQPSYVPTSGGGWLLDAAAPTTVLAAQVAAGDVADPFYGDNIFNVDATAYDVPWWYRGTFVLPAPAPTVAALRLRGISYKADVWVNGVQVGAADVVVGTFTYFDLNVTAAVAAGAAADGTCAVALRLHRQHDRALPPGNHDVDLGISFIDWAPPPPDSSLGVWREAAVTLGYGDAAVTVDYPLVATTRLAADASAAWLRVAVEVTNWSPDAPATIDVAGAIALLPLDGAVAGACDCACTRASASAGAGTCAPRSAPQAGGWRHCGTH